MREDGEELRRGNPNNNKNNNKNNNQSFLGNLGEKYGGMSMLSVFLSREAMHDVQRHKRHKLMNRSKPRDDEAVECFPISAPRYDFEYPLPKFGKESRFNLLFDDQNNPWFQWPLKNYKPMKGNYLPVHRLLFTPERDFLINNTGHKFDAAHLQDKILVILILSLRPEEREKTNHFTGALRKAYMELCSRSDIGFEVIFVAAEDAPGGGGILCSNNLMLPGGGGGLEQEFDALFKLMPWLAIPYSDKHARQICEESLHDPSRFGPVSCYLLQTNGLIMLDWPAVFTIYGAKAFPFTSQRLEELEYENLSFFMDPPSMKELLGDSVISPQGDLVRAANLENKVVGLFFPVDPIINELLPEVWEALKSRHGDFEIVVVPLPYTSARRGHFPFSTLSDTSLCQKLWWIYHPPQVKTFVPTLINNVQGSLLLLVLITIVSVTTMAQTYCTGLELKDTRLRSKELQSWKVKNLRS